MLRRFAALSIGLIDVVEVSDGVFLLAFVSGCANTSGSGALAILLVDTAKASMSRAQAVSQGK